MSDDTCATVGPGPDPRSVRLPSGMVRRAPDDWTLVPPGDAALTRRIKAGGACWVVQERKGRRTFSRGVWAPADRVAAIRSALAVERADPAHERKLAAAAARRERAQGEYVVEFRQAVLRFLDFPLQHHDLAEDLAQRVASHATPVGSGTVARTRRIPVERRAEAAVIAWLRHQTSAYDDMHIPRIKGRRRETRRMLAERSRELLDRYRSGRGNDEADCPLRSALT
ncbi:MAG: DUF2293 domain-containing protein [Planctomycetes bacterium]|nr:DUF2293 domain-containing protein [Planctomycetota bacterium]